MASSRIVVVGGGYAGVMAALRARARGGAGVEVTLVSLGDSLVERIRLHELAVRDRPVHHPLADLVRGTGIALVNGRVLSVDTAGKAVVLADRRVPYDRLILTAGSATGRGGVPGAREHARGLEPGEVVALRGDLDRMSAVGGGRGRVLVGGAGLTGIEIATEIAEAHPRLEVTLVTGGVVGELLAPGARRHADVVLRRLGVHVAEGVRVREIAEGRAETDGGPLPFDACVWTGGFVASPLAREAGLRVDERGQALVDPLLHAVGHDDVFVAGDAARPMLDPGSRLFPGCKTAMPTGAHAAENAVRSLRGQPEQPFDFRDTGYCVSLGRRDGVIDVARPGGNLTLTGRLAVFVKERICRYTVASLRWERAGLFRYQWLHTGRAPRALDAGPQGASLVSPSLVSPSLVSPSLVSPSLVSPASREAVS